jgi:hypothetical protein
LKKKEIVPMNFRLLMLFALAASTAMAAPITYSWKFSSSAQLGDINLTQKNFKVVLTADTTGVFQPNPTEYPNYYENTGSATILIEGLGLFNFWDDMRVSVNPFGSGGLVEFGLIDSHFLVNITNSSLSSYQLQARNPITSSASLIVGPSFGTSGGELTFTASTDVLTFEAITDQAVPEPATFLMISCTFASILLFRHRRNSSRD